jgi:hypothetical protein
VETGLLSVSANGIEAFADYVDIIRDKVPELEAAGVEYEEHDRREPITAALLIAIATGALSGAASATVKTIIEHLSEKAQKEPAGSRPQIQVVINNLTFHLPADQACVLDELDKAPD